MSQSIKCPSCNGLKFILGMGGMKTDCFNCAKTGWVSSNPETILSASEVDQLHADLKKMMEISEVLQTENEQLKAELAASKKTKQLSKTKKSSTGK
jgi:outer membrane murein-binding lipoprotein Lpp